MEFTETSHLVADARKLGLDDHGPDGRPEVPGVVLRTEAEAPKTILEAVNLPKTAI